MSMFTRQGEHLYHLVSITIIKTKTQITKAQNINTIYMKTKWRVHVSRILTASMKIGTSHKHPNSIDSKKTTC